MRENGLRVWGFGRGRSAVEPRGIPGGAGQGVKGRTVKVRITSNTHRADKCCANKYRTPGPRQTLVLRRGDLGLWQRGGWRIEQRA